MNTTKTISMILGFVAALGGASFAADGANPFEGLQEEMDRARFVYETTPENRLGGPDVDKLALDIMRAARITMRRATGPNDTLTVFRHATDASALIEIEPATGALLFNRGYDELRGDNSTPGLVKGAAATEIAKGQLRQLGLLPEDAQELRLEHIGGVNMGVHRPDGTTELFEKLTTIRFGRTIDGLAVQGPGGRLIVHLGTRGSLNGVVRNWQTFQERPLATSDKLSALEVQNLAMQRLSQSSAAVERQIDSAQVVLYDDGDGVMEPAVHVMATITLEGPMTLENGMKVTKRFENPVDFYIPLAREPQALFPFIKDKLAEAPTPKIEKG